MAFFFSRSSFADVAWHFLFSQRFVNDNKWSAIFYHLNKFSVIEGRSYFQKQVFFLSLPPLNDNNFKGIVTSKFTHLLLTSVSMGALVTFSKSTQPFFSFMDGKNSTQSTPVVAADSNVRKTNGRKTQHVSTLLVWCHLSVRKTWQSNPVFGTLE